MSISFEQLKNAALDLPDDERAELTHLLIQSLDEKEADDIRKEWISVAKRRLEELRSGKVKGIPAAEVLRDLLKPRS